MGKKTKQYLYSIEHEQQAEIKIKRSRFICTLKRVESLENAKAFITKKAKDNKTANHNCWAYIIGEHAQISHCSDAGEPAGTAGKPMLNVLQRHDMTDIAAVVTRFFGGVKLGVRGLIDAYTESVEAALSQKPLQKLVKTMAFHIEVTYPFNDSLLNHLKKFNSQLLNTDYSDLITHEVEVESDDSDRFLGLLENFQNQGLLTYRITP